MAHRVDGIDPILTTQSLDIGKRIHPGPLVNVFELCWSAAAPKRLYDENAQGEAGAPWLSLFPVDGMCCVTSGALR